MHMNILCTGIYCAVEYIVHMHEYIVHARQSKTLDKGKAVVQALLSKSFVICISACKNTNTCSCTTVNTHRQGFQERLLCKEALKTFPP